ncbi:MAG: hypothetical protein R2770_07410 [Acidimicrobiales bacterium]
MNEYESLHGEDPEPQRTQADFEAIRSALSSDPVAPSPLVAGLFHDRPRSHRVSRLALVAAAAATLVLAGFAVVAQRPKGTTATVAASAPASGPSVSMAYVAPAPDGAESDGATQSETSDSAGSDAPDAQAGDTGFWYCVFVATPEGVPTPPGAQPGVADEPPLDDCVTIDGFEPMTPEELAALFPEFGPLVDLAARFPDGFEFPDGFDLPGLLEFPDLFDLPEGFEFPDDFGHWDIDHLPQLFEFPDPADLDELFQFELPEGFVELDPSGQEDGCRTFSTPPAEQATGDAAAAELTICLDNGLGLDTLDGDLDEATARMDEARRRIEEAERRLEEFFDRVFKRSQ